MRDVKDLIRISGIAVIFVAAVLARPADAVTLSFAEQTRTMGGDILLGQVARIEGVSGEQRDRLSAMRLGTAPAPGRERVINTDYIVMRLLAEGFPREEIQINAPARVVVLRESQMLDAQAVGAAVKNYLESMLPPSAVVEITRLPQSQPLPQGEVTYEVEPIAAAERRGPFYVYVNCRVGDEATRVNVGVDVGVYEQVVVSARKIERGEILQLHDLTYKFRDVTRLPQNVCRNAFELVGQRARRVIAEDQEILPSMVESPAVIRTGQTVTLTASCGGVVVTVAAEARQNGRVGDVIRVRNTQSHAMIQARIIDANTVESLE